jgi:hypothetical protein
LRPTSENAAQVSGELRPVPRWSTRTTSRVRRISLSRAANEASSLAAWPGPPARMTNGSGFGVSVFAARTATWMPIVRPFGFSRSSGTVTMPQRAAVASGQATGFQRERARRVAIAAARRERDRRDRERVA